MSNIDPLDPMAADAGTEIDFPLVMMQLAA